MMMNTASIYERPDLMGERLKFWRRAIWRAHYHAASDSDARTFAEALLTYTGYADDVSIAGAWNRWREEIEADRRIGL